MDDWAGGEGAELSRTSVDTSAWLPATVPGTVLGSLVEQGKLPDPVAGSEQPARPGGALAPLLVVQAGLRAAARPAHRRPAATCGWSSTASTTRPTCGSTASRSAT